MSALDAGDDVLHVLRDLALHGDHRGHNMPVDITRMRTVAAPSDGRHVASLQKRAHGVVDDEVLIREPHSCARRELRDLDRACIADAASAEVKNCGCAQPQRSDTSDDRVESSLSDDRVERRHSEFIDVLQDGIAMIYQRAEFEITRTRRTRRPRW